MKKTVTKIGTENKTLVEVIKNLTPRQAIDKKSFPEYYSGLEEVLHTCFKVYQARENGKSTDELESQAKTEVTKFLHTLGKANGKYISVCETMTENGITSVLFDTLVYHSFNDRIYTVSETLATLEREKKTASKKKNEAHEKLISGKGTAKEYKEAVKVYQEAEKKVSEERLKKGAENTLTTEAKKNAFIKFATARLKAIIEKRYSISLEEAEKLRKKDNKARKDKRSQAKAESKKPETKAENTKKTA